VKIFFSLLILISVSFASNQTIEVIKKVDSLPSLAIEDASTQYNETFKEQFFKMLVADMNVISIFNVDRNRQTANFNASEVATENRDMNYVLRYRLIKGDGGALQVAIKLMNMDGILFSKSYRVSSDNIYMFVAHSIAHDVNEFMGEPSVEWMKRKVLFSRIVAPRKSEIVIADYTLTYQHVVIKNGFNIFPKWANRAQNSFYYTDFGARTPTLKHVDIAKSKITPLMSSDGMIVCSDVSVDGTTLLLTIAEDGQPDVYTYNTKTKKYKRQTVYGGIDVGAQFMGTDKIAFVSSRLGYPNIFSKDLKSGEIEQVVYYGNSNSACAAHGEYIVYKARETSSAFERNTFNLHLISTKTSTIRRLTAVGVNEFPRFSKDGDAVIFIKNYKEQSSIGIVRLSHNKNYLFPLKFGKLQSMDW